MKYYIGMDAHSSTSMFVVLDKDGNELKAQRVKTSESEIIRFLKSIDGKKALTFEESNLSKWLYPLLKKEVDNLVVCNPLYVVRRTGSKNDYLDTLHLGQQLRGGFLTPVFHEDNIFSELRDLVSAYEDLVRMIVQEKNRYKALFRSEARETKGKGIYSDYERIKELKANPTRFVAKGKFELIKNLLEMREDYEDQFKNYAKRCPEIAALTSIPGFGAVRACIAASIICSPYRFKNKYKFWAYSMLVKHQKESDGRNYGSTKIRSNPALKNVFMGAAQTVLRGSSNFRSYYDQMRSKGLSHRAARKNVARRIAAITLSLMKTKRKYQDKYEVGKEKKNKSL